MVWHLIKQRMPGRRLGRLAHEYIDRPSKEVTFEPDAGTNAWQAVTKSICASKINHEAPDCSRPQIRSHNPFSLAGGRALL